MQEHVKITLCEKGETRRGERELCAVKAKHKVKSLGFVCSPSFFSLPAACGLSWLGWCFARLRENGDYCNHECNQLKWLNCWQVT